MEEEFKNIIRQKANDFEVAPDLDWGVIGQRLDNLDKSKIRRLRPAFYIAAAVIAALLVIGGLLQIGNNNNNSNSVIVEHKQDNTQVIKDKDSTEVIERKIIGKLVDNNSIANWDKSHEVKVKNKAIQKIIIETPSLPTLSDSVTNEGQNENQINQDSVFTLHEQQTLFAELTDTDMQTYVEEDKSGTKFVQQNQFESTIKLLDKNKHNEKFSLGLLFASNATNTSSPNSGNSALSSPGYGKTHTQFLVDKLATSNNYDDVEHNLPLTFGISVQKNINSRFAIKTGVTYSYLRSTFGFTRSRIKKTQSLHYIGIPLSGVVNVKNFGRFSLYLSAGGALEKNIAGRTNTNSLGGKVDKDKFTINQLQWSVNAHAGINYRFYKNLALYAEPGWAYYFDDGSGVDTYRTKHPSSFNLQAGFRFGF